MKKIISLFCLLLAITLNCVYSTHFIYLVRPRRTICFSEFFGSGIMSNLTSNYYYYPYLIIIQSIVAIKAEATRSRDNQPTEEFTLQIYNPLD